MDYKYLNEKHLKGFEKYKYSSVDTSPLSNYVMHPFWNQVVKIIPLWIAPNLLTFTGFLFTIFNAGLLTYYDYYFHASSETSKKVTSIPEWVWLLCAISHFLAHTLDGIDGKQARRTNSSGPLGELFDHGVDSWTSLLIPYCIYSLFGRDGEYSYQPIRVLFIFWAIYSTFYLSHWEKYNTGTLYLPWTYDVSQIALFIFYILTYIKSHLVWKFKDPFFNLTSGAIFEIVSHFGSFGLSIPITVYNVYQVYKINKLKQPNIFECLRPLIPMVTVFLVTTYWAIYSPNDVLDKDPRIFYILVGTLFSNIACRLIVSQMSSTQCETFNWFLIPLTIIAFGVNYINFLLNNELFILRGLTIFYIFAHIHYGVCIVRQMCNHLNIYCFKINQKKVGLLKNGNSK